MTIIKKNRVGEKHKTNSGYTFSIIDYRGYADVDIKFDDGTILKGLRYDSIVGGRVAKPINKTGEKYTTNEGYKVEIIKYTSSSNVTIRFEDGTVLDGVSYQWLTLGRVAKPLKRIGEKHITNEGYEVEIIEYFGCTNCTIKFKDTTILRGISYDNIKKGLIKNPYHRTVYSIGYRGQGKYSDITKENKKIYKKWHGVLQRCGDIKFSERNTSYKNCSLSEEWRNLQNFGVWYEENWKYWMDSSWHLDKDILKKGNKIYSAETCCFVPNEINLLFVKSEATRGSLPIGVSFYRGRFVAQLNVGSSSSHLGVFDTIEEAFACYKFHKEKRIKTAANKWKYKITEQVYQVLINYKVEITD